jgi:hypothetical protein
MNFIKKLTARGCRLRNRHLETVPICYNSVKPVFHSTVDTKIFNRKIIFLHSFAGEKKCTISLVVENFQPLSDLPQIAPKNSELNFSVVEIFASGKRALVSIVKLVRLQSLIVKRCKTRKIWPCKVSKVCIFLYYAQEIDTTTEKRY